MGLLRKPEILVEFDTKEMPAYKLTSFVLRGWTTAFEGEMTLPLKTAVAVLNLDRA